MAELPVKSSNTSDGTSTIVVTAEEAEAPEGTVRLKLRKPKTDKQVQWITGTVDNEHMNKKKSKCCCIYKKPRKFDESSSSSDDEEDCEHCHGQKDGHCLRPPPPDAAPDASEPPLEADTSAG